MKFGHDKFDPPIGKNLHERDLSAEEFDQHRALVSLYEEIEAADWYNQRSSAADDDALKKILRHNRDDEFEHAAMLLEWLRRRIPELDEQLREFLFQDGNIEEED